MVSRGHAFLTEYAQAKIDTLDATHRLLTRLTNASTPELKHAVDFAGKVLGIERKLGGEKRAALTAGSARARPHLDPPRARLARRACE